MISTLLSIFLIVTQAWAMDLDQAALKSGDRVGLYWGSFDPIHIGHQKTIENAFKAGKLDYIIVLPGVVSLLKPQRTSYDLRVEMLRKLFEKNEKVLVHAKGFGLATHSKIAAEISKKTPGIEFFGIIGYDNVEKNQGWKEKLQSKVGDGIKGWIIDPRNSPDPSQIPKIFRGSETIIIEEPTIGYSSTKVRNYLDSHPDFYTTSTIPPISELPVDPVVRQFIRETGLYRVSPKGLTIRECANLLKETFRAIKDTP